MAFPIMHQLYRPSRPVENDNHCTDASCQGINHFCYGGTVNGWIGVFDEFSSLKGCPSSHWPGRYGWWCYISRPVPEKGKKEKKEFHVRLKYQVLIQHLGWKQSTSRSTTSLPHQFDSEVSSICTGGAFLSGEICIQGSSP